MRVQITYKEKDRIEVYPEVESLIETDNFLKLALKVDWRKPNLEDEAKVVLINLDLIERTDVS